MLWMIFVKDLPKCLINQGLCKEEMLKNVMKVNSKKFAYKGANTYAKA
jgi:hypothetical protein